MEVIAKVTTWIKSHILTSILIVAAIVRIAGLDRVPASLNWDEVSMGYSAYSIMKTGRDEWGEFMPLLFRSYGEWKSPVYIYLLVPFIKVFGLNAWGVRLPAALAGVIAVYLTYLLGRKLYTQKVGLVAAALLTVSPWHLMLSRPGFEASVALTLTLLGIYTFIRATEPGSTWRDWIVTGVAFGLGPHTYNSAKVVVPLLVLVLVWVYRRSLRLKNLIVLGSVLLIFATPLLLGLVSGKSQGRYKQVGITTDAELTTNFYEYRKTFPLPDIANRVIFSKYTFFVVKGFQNWVSYFSPSFLITEAGPRPQHSIPYRGVLYIVEGIALIVGLTQLKKQKGFAKIFPLALIGIGFIPPALTKDAHHVLRSIMTLPAWQLLASLGLVHLMTMKPQYTKIVGGVLAVEVIGFLAIYFFWYPHAFARDWQYGYKQAIEYAVQNQDKYQRIVFTKWYGEPQLFLAFYGKLDPEQFQRDNKALIRYEEMGLPWLDQLQTYSIGKYVFEYQDWKGPGTNTQTLYIGKGDDFWADTTYLKQIEFPNGDVAFNIVEGQ